jgi:hypothetical protein
MEAVHTLPNSSNNDSIPNDQRHLVRLDASLVLGKLTDVELLFRTGFGSRRWVNSVSVMVT